MAQFFQNIRLSDQPLLDHLIVFHAVLADFLDRPLFIGTFIHCQVDDAHAALPDLIQYFIFTVDY